MENFLSTVVFLLPGILMYFWIQSFGVNPVVKHSSIELTAISALLWLPVTVATLLLINLSILIVNNIPEINMIWSLEDLQVLSGNLIFLLVFLFLSTIVSFLLSVFYTKFLFCFQLKVINKVRKWRGVAAYSNTSSVWDEMFLNDDPMVVEIGKIDSKEKSQIGCIIKASRPFEPERHLVLNDVDYFTKLVRKHNIPVINSFIDLKTNTFVKVFDPEKIKSFQLVDNECKLTSSEE